MRGTWSGVALDGESGTVNGEAGVEVGYVLLLLGLALGEEDFEGGLILHQRLTGLFAHLKVAKLYKSDDPVSQQVSNA